MKLYAKRFTAVLLALALCLSLFPLTAAAETDIVSITSLSEITDLSGSYKLTADLTVTEPFGSQAEPFNGTLDGDGHTVTIDITAGSANTGMFAYLGSSAVVKNFVVDSANVTSTASATGAIAGTSKGTISDIRVQSLTVNGMEKTGGLVGVLESGAVLTRCCVDSGTVKKGSTSDTGFGGLVGESSGAVSLCSANVTLDHSDARPNYDYTGGIVGRNQYGSSIADSYFTGSFSEGSNKSYKIGGIAGDNSSGKITNCHFCGTLVSSASSQGPIAYNGTVTNCYYLDTAYTSSTGYGTKKTADEFAVLAETLGGNWENGTDGYPVLIWQTWKYSNTAIKYTVETYLETVDGDGYALSSTAEKKAEPGEAVSVEASAIEGFTFDAENENNVTSGEASADLVLKLYYTRNSYTLTWATGDYAIASADDAYTHGSVKYGAQIVYPELALTGMSVKWDKTLTTMPAEDTTVTASYAPSIYNVTWNANGGKLEKSDGWGGTNYVETLTWSGYGSSGGAIFGQTFGKYKWNENSTSASNRSLPVPMHDTLVFDGWYTAAEGGEPLTADTEVTVPADGSFTFYAHWIEGWTVTFDPNGGSVSPKTALVRKGGTLGASIPTPSRSGYDFVGWYNGEDKLEADTVIDADATYTAQWTPKTYTVSFNANGGEGTMEAQTFTYGVAQQISKNLFTRTGYRFVGWATWSSATSASYTDEQEYTIGAYNQTFYAVWEEVRYDLTVTVTPADATIVLKDASGNVQTATDGVYNLREGTYTYTVSAYGYETATGEIVLTENTTFPIALVKLPSYTVSFAVTKPEGTGDVQITVTDADGKVMAASEDGTYDLIAGSYHYLVKAQGATKAAADFIVEDKALHFEITLALRTGWDGETVTEPHQITADEAVGDYEGMTGWYLIENGEELAWIANKVNNVSGGYNANVVLAKDIDLGGELWTPMGNSYNYCFAGTFDGAGHTIKNLYCEGTTYQGLFGYSKGTIRNLTVSGTVTLTLSGTGGYEANAGGIVAYQNNGRIENCASYVTVTNLHGSGRTGGIAAYANNSTIVSSFNAGTLTGGISVAGIVGYCGGSSTISDCYNIGTLIGGDNIVETSYTFGQIAGIVSTLSDYSSSMISNCYHAGTITQTDKYSRIGAIASARGAASFNNCYYLEADGIKAIGNGLTDGCTAVDAETLASAHMPADLSEAFKQDTGCGGTYPILTWQTLREHSFTNAASDVIAKEATCTEAASYYVKCDNCDTVSTTLTVTVGEALGHSDYQYTDNGDGTHKVTCGVCSEVITASEAHVYVEGTCPCGATETPVVPKDENLKFLNVSLSLQECIQFTYMAKYTGVLNNYDSYYVAFSRNDFKDGLVENQDSGYKYSTRYHCFSYSVWSMQMNDEITATLYGVKNGVIYEGETVVKSVRDYVEEKFSAVNEATKLVYANMLQYGAMAQVNFAYDTENLVTTGLRDEITAYITTEAPATVNQTAATNNGLTAVKLAQNALGTQDAVKLQYVLNIGTSDVNSLYAVATWVNEKGETVEKRYEGSQFTKQGKYYIVLVDGLNAVNGKVPVSLTVYDASTNAAVSETFTCSIQSQVYARQTATNNTTAKVNALNLMNALMNYYNACEALFG